MNRTFSKNAIKSLLTSESKNATSRNGSTEKQNFERKAELENVKQRFGKDVFLRELDSIYQSELKSIRD